MNRHIQLSGNRCGWPAALLFDLDGTLIDSVPDITTAANKLLATEALAPLALDEVREMIGNGIAKLVERAFAARDVVLDGDRQTQMTERMMAIYQDHLTDGTKLMDGAEEMLRAYDQAGVKLAVVTNKPEGFTRDILEHFGLADIIDCIVGGDSGPTRKPAPDMLFHAAEAMGIGIERSVMVGDSPADIGAAKAAGMASIAVEGGYTPIPAKELGADVVVGSLHQLPSAIEQLKEPV
ncbi:phosphoglycolate phosphatase [Roseibium sp.]|uniref:phosphoglycolate phosphatase n=1 Tax=Roseibium sp. TaxID=1936156 RepID=UPI003A987DE2